MPSPLKVGYPYHDPSQQEEEKKMGPFRTGGFESLKGLLLRIPYRPFCRRDDLKQEVNLGWAVCH